MRITLVGPTNPYKGGIAQHTTELAIRLAQSGHDVDLLSWAHQYPKRLYPGELELRDTSSEPAFPSTRRVLDWYNPYSWWRHARHPSGPADLVVLSVANGFQIPAYVAILARARRVGSRVVAVCHNVIPHEADRVQMALVRWLLRRIDLVLVHSADEARNAADVGAACVVTSAMPFHFPAAPRTSRGEPSHRVVTFGLVRPYKGVEVLIDALAMMENEVVACVAGEFWTPAEQLRQRAREKGVGDRLDLREGYLAADAVVELLAGSDALVLPYVSGTGSQQPRVARLAGAPVVASRLGAFAEQVRDGVDGILVEPGSAEDLARALDELYEPGRLDALRSEVVPLDVEPEWAEYLDALTGVPGVSTASG